MNQHEVDFDPAETSVASLRKPDVNSDSFKTKISRENPVRTPLKLAKSQCCLSMASPVLQMPTFLWAYFENPDCDCKNLLLYISYRIDTHTGT